MPRARRHGACGAGGAGGAGSRRVAPFGGEDGVDDLVGPLALDEFVLHEVCLAAHAESLQHSGRQGVTGVDPSLDAMQAQLVEAQPQQRGAGLGGVAAPAVVRVEHVPDLAAAMLGVAPEQHGVAHQRASVTFGDTQQHRLARFGHLAAAGGDPVLDLAERARRVQQVPADVLAGQVCVNRLGVAGLQRAEQKALGLDRVRRSQHSVIVAAGPGKAPRDNVAAMGCTASVVWDEGYLAYDFGDHPLNPVRLDLTIRLARELGVLDAVTVLAPVPADEPQLLTVHDPDYLAAVREAGADPSFAGYGLGTTDDPVFPGMYEASALIGRGAAEGTSVNVALPPGTDDSGWLRAFRAVVPGAVRAFGPDVLVTQCGCDTHHDDPLANLELSVDGQRTAIKELHALAHEVSSGRWLALGGGGYGLVGCVPRTWTHLIAEASGRPVDPATSIPPGWANHVRGFGGHPPQRMGELPDGTQPTAEPWAPGGESWLDRAI